MPTCTVVINTWSKQMNLVPKSTKDRHVLWDWRRVMLGPVEEGRLRLDAATWGTMGVGMGCAVAAAVTRPDRLVVAVEGDSAFGFSGMECETIARRGPAVLQPE